MSFIQYWLIGAAIVGIVLGGLALVYGKSKLAGFIYFTSTISILITSMWSHWPLSNESWVWSGGGFVAGLIGAGSVVYLRRTKT